MRKIIAAFALGSVALLSACGGNDTPTPVETVTVPASPDTDINSPEPYDRGGNSPDDGGAAEQTAAEQEFVYDIQNNGMTDDLGPVPQADVIELGYLVCEALDRDTTVEDILTVITDNGVNPTDAGLIVGSASINLCPEHFDSVQRQADALVSGNPA